MPLPLPPPNPQPLYTLRLARRLTQGDVARMIEETQPTISRLERGQQVPSRQQIAKLARVLKVQPDAIFDRLTLSLVLRQHKAAS